MMISTTSLNDDFAARRPVRFLERTLLFSLVVHLLAMASMAVLLIPGMPGNSPLSDGPGGLYRRPSVAVAGRLAALAPERIGRPAAGAGVAAAAGGAPAGRRAHRAADGAGRLARPQIGQGLWETQGVALAQSGPLAAYLAWEAPVFAAVAGWGALFYSLAALGWTWGSRRRPLGTRDGPLFGGALGVVLVASFSALAPGGLGPLAPLVPVMNALGFVLMLGWLAILTEVLAAAFAAASRPRALCSLDPSRPLAGRTPDLAR